MIYIVLAVVQDWCETGEGSYRVVVKNVFCAAYDNRLQAEQFIKDYDDDIWQATKLYIKELEINSHDPDCCGCLFEDI